MAPPWSIFHGMKLSSAIPNCKLTSLQLYRKMEKRLIEHEDILHVIIRPKHITPFQGSLQDSLLNPPFNFNSKYRFKDIDNQVQDDLKETN